MIATKIPKNDIARVIISQTEPFTICKISKELEQNKIKVDRKTLKTILEDLTDSWVIVKRNSSYILNERYF